MASPQHIETLRQMASAEAMMAACEQRAPDIATLDEIGKLVLPDFAPVLCDSPVYYYRDFNGSDGYKYTRHDDMGCVSGLFGGFFTGVVEMNFDTDGIQQVNKVGYFVLDTDYKDTGYICPVETSTLHDVLGSLDDEDEPEDELFGDIQCVMGQEIIDVQELCRLLSLIDLNSTHGQLLRAYVCSVLYPKDIFSSVTSDNGLLYNNDHRGFGTHFSTNGVVVNVDRSDVLAIVELTKMSIFREVSSGDMTPKVNKSLEFAIKKGRDPSIFVPLKWIVGHELPVLH